VSTCKQNGAGMPKKKKNGEGALDGNHEYPRNLRYAHRGQRGPDEKKGRWKVFAGETGHPAQRVGEVVKTLENASLS